MDSNQAALAWKAADTSMPLEFFWFMNQNRLLWLRSENGSSKHDSPVILLSHGTVLCLIRLPANLHKNASVFAEEQEEDILLRYKMHLMC